jgi:4a-hydroxytetrahydrobiopterin dehydratase
MAEALNDAAIAEALAQLPGWEREGDMIVKTYALPSYPAGLAFASAVGIACDALDHHPDLYIGYKKVEVRFTTHDAGSKISMKDIDAAMKIEALNYPRG